MQVSARKGALLRGRRTVRLDQGRGDPLINFMWKQMENLNSPHLQKGFPICRITSLQKGPGVLLEQISFLELQMLDLGAWELEN